MHFHQLPQQKLEFIERLQAAGKKVAMIGDGLNDAGALQQARVGISVTDDVTRFVPASDAIMSGDQLLRIDDFLRFATQSRRAILITFAFSLVYNVVGLYFGVQGRLSPLVAAVLMPLSSITVVLLTALLVYVYAKRARLL